MDILELLKNLFSGVTFLFSLAGVKTLAMFVISGTLIYLAIKKDYEPALLLPIGFGAILANLPPVLETMMPSALGTAAEPGFLKVLFEAGIRNELFRVLILSAVGAMIDFSPLMKDPSMIFFGAAAQLVSSHVPGTLVLLPLVLPASQASDTNLIFRLASAIGMHRRG